MAISNSETNSSLDAKIVEFKNDPQKMKQVNDFLNDMFTKAKIEAQHRQNKKVIDRIQNMYFIVTDNLTALVSGNGRRKRL